MAKLLFTGFEPFGGEHINASWAAVRQLDGRQAAPKWRIAVARLPVSRRRAVPALFRAMARHDPAIVICVGEAGGRAAINVERIAINVDDYRIADNDGARPVDRPIAAGGPPAFWSSLPLRPIVAAIRAARIPCEISNSAGTYLCNHVFYALMHKLTDQSGRRLGGFIHVPICHEQNLGGDKASLAVDTIAQALAAAARAAAREFAMTARSRRR